MSLMPSEALRITPSYRPSLYHSHLYGTGGTIDDDLGGFWEDTVQGTEG